MNPMITLLCALYPVCVMVSHSALTQILRISRPLRQNQPEGELRQGAERGVCNSLPPWTRAGSTPREERDKAGLLSHQHYLSLEKFAFTFISRWFLLYLYFRQRVWLGSAEDSMCVSDARLRTRFWKLKQICKQQGWDFTFRLLFFYL